MSKHNEIGAKLLKSLEAGDSNQIHQLSHSAQFRQISGEQLSTLISASLEYGHPELAIKLLSDVDSSGVPEADFAGLILKALDVECKKFVTKFCTNEHLKKIPHDEIDSIIEKAKEKNNQALIDKIYQITDL